MDRRVMALLTATLPVAVVAALTWFGVFLFVNAYLVSGLGYSNVDWAAAMLWLSGGMLVWYPVLTEVSARFGRHKTVLVGLSAASLAYFGLAVSAHPWAVRGLMALIGAAQAAYLVAWTPYVADAGGDKPGRAMSLSALVLNLVTCFVLIFGGQLVASGRYRLTFLVLGSVGALCVVAFHVLARRLEKMVRAETGAPVKRPAITGMFALRGTDWRGLVTGPFMVVVFLGICAAPFAFQTSNQLFPNLCRDMHGLKDGTIAWVVGMGRIPSLVSLFAIAHVIDRWNKMRCYGVGLMLDGAALAAVALAPGAGAVVGFYLLFYLFHGSVWAAALPAVNGCVRPELRDAAFAITLMLEMASIFITGVVHKTLLDEGVRLPAVFIVCAGVTVLCGLALCAYSLTQHARRGPL